MNIIQFDRITELSDVQVILDSDVAELYGVETRDINKAVKNNPDKFPEGYIVTLSKEEFENLRWKFSSTKLTMTRALPKAFTETTIELVKKFDHFAKFKHTIKKKK